MKKRITAIILIATLILGCFTVASFGYSPKKKMMVYNDVLKKGNTVYCSAGGGIYKVNLKTKQVRRLVWIDPDYHDTAYGMKLHKGYLYYINPSPMIGYLYRIKTNGTGNKYLAMVHYYAISKNKIYYESSNLDSWKRIHRQMKLNGKSKKKSKYTVKKKSKRTNAKGYGIYIQKNGTVREYDDYDDEPYYVYKYTDYLKTPKGLIKLYTYTVDDEL